MRQALGLLLSPGRERRIVRIVDLVRVTDDHDDSLREARSRRRGKETGKQNCGEQQLPCQALAPAGAR
jgi:hypothetical protein